MQRKCYYMKSINSFLSEDAEQICGFLLQYVKDEVTAQQKGAWRSEIEILKKELANFKDGDIALEYNIPRLGRQIDAVCIIDGIIFLLEFKVGDREYKKSTDDQVMDYALDLKYFHEGSEKRYIVPISVPTAAKAENNCLNFSESKIAKVLHCNKDNISANIQMVLGQYSDTPLDIETWANSNYSPTPTIVEAAQALYRGNSVEDISRNDAGAENLTKTAKAVNEIIEKSKNQHHKSICFITGVPGAGKTLAGLNLVEGRSEEQQLEEPAVFLSGNGPLVRVLREALAQDKYKHDKENGEPTTIGDARRDVESFIQHMYQYRNDILGMGGNEAPHEKIVVFDEAQRAWDKDQLSKFINKRNPEFDFDMSEPDFMLSAMDRHKDWAVLVCLVGGGQEINTGEAGIQEWFNVLANKYLDWDIYLAEEKYIENSSEYVADFSIKEILGARPYNTVPGLHLNVATRSFRCDKLSEFVKLLLDNKPEDAAKIYSDMNGHYPIFITRDLKKAKNWVKAKAEGSERYGLLASSKAKRLLAEGIVPLEKAKEVPWFLNSFEYPNSSYSLETAASEFDIQGLEIEYSLVAWDADLRYENGEFAYYTYQQGVNWCMSKEKEKQKYIKNAYRVLLTRARQGMVIFVPKGDSEDQTRNPQYYDVTYEYLKSIGIEELK